MWEGRTKRDRSPMGSRAWPALVAAFLGITSAAALAAGCGSNVSGTAVDGGVSCECGSADVDAAAEASPPPDGADASPAPVDAAPSPTDASSDGASHGESTSCAALTSTNGVIRDAAGNVWTLVTGADGTLTVDENGAAAGYTDGVVQLAYVSHVVSQENTSHSWWSWIGGAWLAAADPTVACRDGGSTGGVDSERPPATSTSWVDRSSTRAARPGWAAASTSTMTSWPARATRPRRSSTR